MLSFDDALQKVMATVGPGRDERLPPADALGRVLLEDVAASDDSPPHDKSLVDGYAVRSADFNRRPIADAAHPIELAVLEEVAAGALPTARLTAGHATRIMTGAPLPEGADAVVMVEQTRWHAEPRVPGGVVTFDAAQVEPEQNVMRRGVSFRRGEVVLRAGALLRPAEIALLAEVGRREVRVARPPRVALLATGNELVDASLAPAAGQIRNSNGPLLVALVRQAGGVPIDLGIGRDDEALLRTRIAEGLTADVMVLSGGVSAGVFDLVPKALKDLGVAEVFHKVAIRPGKPVWFGVRHGGDSPTLVFGLPGNPVSVLLCFDLFVAPVLARLAGHAVSPDRTRSARLASDFQHRGERTTYHPGRLQADAAGCIVETAVWHGSSDLKGLAGANVWAIFPPGDRLFRAGEQVECRPM